MFSVSFSAKTSPTWFLINSEFYQVTLIIAYNVDTFWDDGTFIDPILKAGTFHKANICIDALRDDQCNPVRYVNNTKMVDF